MALIIFYITAAVVVAAALRVVTAYRAVHALLYLITALLGLALEFLLLGAPFAAALQVIVYAGAIMVLFVFVVMMLDLGGAGRERERAWLRTGHWRGPVLLCVVLLGELSYLLTAAPAIVSGGEVSAKAVGTALFGPYMLAVELASFLLLAGMVVALHLTHGREAA